MNIAVLGSTGLCGNEFLKHCVASDAVNHVWSLSRRTAKGSDNAKVTAIVAPSSEWASKLPKATDVVFSGVATTRGAAGSLENQYKIDHDLQLELARAARASGAHTFVVVSSTGADSSSWFGYMQMKGQLEKDVVALDFPKTVILRPGPLLGREDYTTFKGQSEGLMQYLGKCVHRTWFQGLLAHPVYASEVAAGTLKAVQTLPDGVHYVSSQDILAFSDN